MGTSEEAADTILADIENMRQEYEGRIESVKKEYEIEKLLTQSGARNLKAVRALLGDGSVEELAGEIEALKKGEDTRFLFEKRASFAPARSGEKLPDAGKSSYEALLDKARKSGNTLEAIRIKQKAASEGIMLL